MTPSDAPMTSAEFRELRLALGLSQSALGKLMGMLIQDISRIETGRRAPTKIQAAFLRYITEHPPKK